MFGVGGVWGWQFFIFCRAFKQTQPGVVHLLLLESLTDDKALMPFSSTAYVRGLTGYTRQGKGCFSV